jgi:hypothetical protein
MAMVECVAVGCVVWLDGQEWATCRTPGQAARVAEDMRAADAAERRMSNLLDTVERPASVPEGAPGSLHRRAWGLGKRLDFERTNDRIVEMEDILRSAYPVLRQADQWSLVDRIDKIRG